MPYLCHIKSVIQDRKRDLLYQHDVPDCVTLTRENLDLKVRQAFYSENCKTTALQKVLQNDKRLCFLVASSDRSFPDTYLLQKERTPQISHLTPR